MAASRKAPRSGDADLPQKEPLYERRAKFDSVRARQQVGGWPEGLQSKAGVRSLHRKGACRSHLHRLLHQPATTAFSLLH